MYTDSVREGRTPTPAPALGASLLHRNRILYGGATWIGEELSTAEQLQRILFLSLFGGVRGEGGVGGRREGRVRGMIQQNTSYPMS